MKSDTSATPASAHQPCPARVGAGTVPSGDILVAWDDSHTTIAALQAVADHSQDNHIILAELGRARPSADDAMAWLISRGATARVQRLSRLDPPGAALRRLCGSVRPSHCLAGGLCRQAAAIPHRVFNSAHG